jgi:hypothetical protein
MNRWLLIRRLRWPAFIILFGITALLNQWGLLSLRRSWPLYLILAGLLMLAERAALLGASPVPLPGQKYGQPYPPPSTSATSNDLQLSDSGSSSAVEKARPAGENGRA